jgi:hypothetical protein
MKIITNKKDIVVCLLKTKHENRAAGIIELYAENNNF